MFSRLRSFRPNLERLETRWCPAVDAFMWGRTLIVRGDAADNVISVFDNGNGNVSANISGATGSASISGSNVISVRIYANDGDDVVSYNLTNDLVVTRNISIYLGRGNDDANVNLNAGIDSAFLNAMISGWTGNDDVVVDAGAVTDSRVLINTLLHVGEDTADVRFNASVTRSIVNANTNAGAGNDKISADLGHMFDATVNVRTWANHGDDSMNATLSGNLNGASNVSLMTWDSFGNDLTVYQATGVNVDTLSTLSLRTSSYHGLDQADITWEGRLDGRLNVASTGGWLADELSANLTVNPNSSGRLSAGITGFWWPDTLTLNVFENVNGDGLAGFTAFINGGWFTQDSITATANVSIFNG